LARCETESEENLEMHVQLEADVPRVFGSWRRPMVQLPGGNFQSSSGHQLFLKKLKMGVPKLEF